MTLTEALLEPAFHLPRLFLIEKDIKTPPQLKLTVQAFLLHYTLQGVLLLIHECRISGRSSCSSISDHLDQCHRLNFAVALRERKSRLSTAVSLRSRTPLRPVAPEQT